MPLFKTITLWPQQQLGDSNGDTCVCLKRDRDVGQRLQHWGEQGSFVWTHVEGWCWILAWTLISLLPWVFCPSLRIHLVLVISFALTATKLVSSVMEARIRIRIRQTANEREHCTVWHSKRCMRKTMKKPSFFFCCAGPY